MIGAGLEAITANPMVGPACGALAAVVVGTRVWPSVASPARTDLAAAVRRSSSGGGLAKRRSIGALVAIAIALVAGPVAVGATGVAALLVRALRPIRAAQRRRTAIERALPDAMDLLVLSVRAGLTPFQAVSDLARPPTPPVGEAFAEVVRRTERGQPFADALAALPEHLGAQAGGLADVIATSDRHGLPLGPVLDQLTAEVRATRRRLDQADARKLPVRLSFPLVVCTLPSFVLLAIAPAVIAALSSLGGTAW